MPYTKPVKSIALWGKAKKLMPGGSQLLSKRAEMFLPDQWPAYYTDAKGCEVTDLDGNTYIDMSFMGIGSCVLGYADPDVNAAVKLAIDRGSMSTLNCPEEIELAELLLLLHPWAQMARFARTGGEALAVAIRIARAASGKDQIAFCGYHGWHDWYISSNLSSDKNLDGHLLPGLEPKGIARGLLGSALPFEYNKIDQFETLAAKHSDIGVIVMEPVRHHEPENNFLQNVRAIADRIGAVLVFDEVTSAWRSTLGGVHLKYGVTPDMAVFAKGMSNGFPMAAVIGKGSVMDAAQTSFISSTYWTERIGPTAALATIKKMRAMNTAAHVVHVGQMIGNGWTELAAKHGLKLKMLTPPELVTCVFAYDNAQAIRTLLTQEMLKRGYLAGAAVYVSYAHTEEIARKYLEVLDEVYGVLKQAIDSGTVESHLEGPVAHSGFKRLT